MSLFTQKLRMLLDWTPSRIPTRIYTVKGVICRMYVPHFSNIFSPDQLKEKLSLVLLCGEPIVRLDRELDEDVPEMI